MKFYVAGKFEEREQVRKIMDTLRTRGHTITTDWTYHEFSDAGYPKQYAIDDIVGVKNADTYVGLFMNPNSYRGALVELGAALGNDKKVVIIGYAIDTCIFLHHPLVSRYDTVNEFLRTVYYVNSNTTKEEL